MDPLEAILPSLMQMKGRTGSLEVKQDAPKKEMVLQVVAFFLSLSDWYIYVLLVMPVYSSVQPSSSNSSSPGFSSTLCLETKQILWQTIWMCWPGLPVHPKKAAGAVSCSSNDKDINEKQNYMLKINKQKRKSESAAYGHHLYWIFNLINLTHHNKRLLYMDQTWLHYCFDTIFEFSDNS